jgi:hypothetical protein
LIRAAPLPSGVRRVRREDLGAFGPGGLTGFAPVRDYGTVVRVKRVRSIE